MFDKEVNEDFPFADMTHEEYGEMEDVLEALGMTPPPEEAMRTMTEADMKALEIEMLAASEGEGETVREDMAESEPVVLVAGAFAGADNFHQGSGTATVYELSDGSRVLRFEDFEVTNGPDLRVLLAEHGDPQSREDIDRGYVELAKLKGNKGDQNYEIPVDINLSEYNSVVIYCKPFHVVFATALLN